MYIKHVESETCIKYLQRITVVSNACIKQVVSKTFIKHLEHITVVSKAWIKHVESNMCIKYLQHVTLVSNGYIKHVVSKTFTGFLSYQMPDQNPVCLYNLQLYSQLSNSSFDGFKIFLRYPLKRGNTHQKKGCPASVGKAPLLDICGV